MRILLLLTLLPLVLPAGSAGADVARLVGTVGPGFTIDLGDATGKHVDSLVAGRYELLVHDLSDMHNFVLGSKATGERLAQTDVEFVGDMTFSVELVPGRYAYACSPHFETMNGPLTVSPGPRRRDEDVDREGRRAYGDAQRKKVAAGRYRMTVVDRSHSRNFHLVGPGVNRRTSLAFRGTATWVLQLRAGAYRFGSDPRLSGRLVVT